MNYSVHITEQADEDIRAIYEYIAYDLLEPEYAIGQLDRIEQSINELSNFPEKFERYKKEPWYSRGLRYFPVDNYLVFYIPDLKNKVIYIIRVFYKGRYIEKELDENTKYGNDF